MPSSKNGEKVILILRVIFLTNQKNQLQCTAEFISKPLKDLFFVFIVFLGDLKESPSLGESSHVMFSQMAKYSSLTAFYTFLEQQPKAIEDKVCLYQS